MDIASHTTIRTKSVRHAQAVSLTRRGDFRADIIGYSGRMLVRDCQWIGDNGQKCGQPKVPDSYHPYCKDHLKIVIASPVNSVQNDEWVEWQLNDPRLQ